MLKQLLEKRIGAGAVIRRLLPDFSDQLCITDADGTVLAGRLSAAPECSFPLSSDRVIWGWIKGRAAVENTALLIQHLLLQEIQQKKLGAELLQQYREINLIYALSGKLADASHRAATADMLLREACQLVECSGAWLSWPPETSAPPTITAIRGTLPARAQEQTFYTAISTNGKSEILELDGPTPAFVLYASLGAGNGAIALFGASAFRAADLKLLVTLAALGAGAMAQSEKHEKETALALKNQKDQLVFELASRNPFFKKTLSIIQANMADPDFSVADLGKSMHLSASQLQRKLVAVSTLTPVELLREMRLKKAKALLTETDLSISEVAYHCGFNDPSYFTRLFTRETGLTPSAWKEKQAN